MKYFEDNSKFSTRQEKNKSVQEAKEDYFDAVSYYSEVCQQGQYEDSGICIATRAQACAAFDTFLELVNVSVQSR